MGDYILFPCFLVAYNFRLKTTSVPANICQDISTIGCDTSQELDFIDNHCVHNEF